MTEYSTFLSDSRVRVRFDPVLDILEQLEQEHGPSLRVEIVDEAMRIYDDLRPAMDRMMAHRGAAQLEAFGHIRRGDFTFSLMVKYDVMVVVEISLGAPPFPDPDGTGGWGNFRVMLDKRERYVRVRGPVIQPTAVLAPPLEPMIASGVVGSADALADGVVPIPVMFAPTAATATLASRNHVTEIQLFALDSLFSGQLVRPLIGLAGEGSVTAKMLHFSDVLHDRNNEQNSILTINIVFENSITSVFNDVHSYSFDVTDIDDYLNYRNEYIRNISYRKYEKKLDQLSNDYIIRSKSVLIVVELQALAAAFACEAEDVRQSIEALERSVADGVLLLVTVHDDPLGIGLTCTSERGSESDRLFQFGCSVIASRFSVDDVGKGECVPEMAYETVTANNPTQSE
jgi:hypothetical protein